MNEVQKADPDARRRAALVLIFAAAIGGLLISAFEHFREPFREWLVSDPAETPRRARLALSVSILVLSTPAIAFAIYLWLLGRKVLRAERFPPPGLRVIRDTPVIRGAAAVTRGHAVQIFAVCLGVAVGVLCLFIWWFAGTISLSPAGRG
ncbi:MAG TPA: hypothetical protein VIA19_07450 [Burkholderiales bacterium]|jgi:hypothetical protein